MREEARKLLRATEQDSPPFSAPRVAYLRKIRGVEWTEVSSLSRLVPIKGGFVIKMNPQALRSTDEPEGTPFTGLQNFSIAHEIGHTFFYDIDSPTPSRPVRDIGSSGEERLCDIFAAELLMPEGKFSIDARRVLQKEGYITKKLIDLRARYGVTMHATAIRLKELDLLSDIVIIRWDWMLNPNKPEDKVPKLRIRWAEPSTYPYIPKSLSARKGSIIEQASFSSQVIFEKSKIRIGSLNGIYPVEALGLFKKHRKDSPRQDSQFLPVLSAIWLNDE